MIALLSEKSRRKQQPKPSAPTFEELLSTITKQARIAFRDKPRSEREELIAEVVANCFVAYVRLVQRGLGHVIYATPLALYAIKQVRAGRRVGSALNIKDISSTYCQHRKGVRMNRLDHYDADEGGWLEIVVEDRRATPADVAATRIDFSDWLTSLKPRARRIAKTLATGETTQVAARKHRVSPARISQFRRELQQAWHEFHGELVVA
jgi:hypothetical protein